MSAAKPITREYLLCSLEPKVSARVFGLGASAVADLITENGLTEVICGRHDNKPVTFGRAFELIYGQRLS